MNEAEQYMYNKFSNKLKELIEINKEEMHNSLENDVLYGESIMEVNKGNIRSIHPYSEEGFNIKDKVKDEQNK